MIDRKRIITLAEEKAFSLIEKDYSDWTKTDKIAANKEFHFRKELKSRNK